MLWWALAILGLTVLVLYAMVNRRHIVFLLVGGALTVLGGLGIGGVLGGPQENPLEAIARGLQGANLIQPAPPAIPTPDTGSSVTPPAPTPPTPPSFTSPSPAPGDPGSDSPSPSAPGATEPAPPPSTPEPASPEPAPTEPTPPVATEPPNPPPTPSTPSEPAPPPPAAGNACPCTLEVNTNVSAVTINLQRENGETLSQSAAPARFENLPAGVYTVTIEAGGSSAYTGTVTLPQTRSLSVYLQR